MSETEAYFLLFTDSFVANLIIGFRSELIIHTMKIFGNYNKLIISLVSTSASLVAFGVNYLFGLVLLNICYFSQEEKNNLINQPLPQFLLKHEIILLCFSIFPFWGNIIPLLAGFIRISFLRMLAVSIFTKLCYYIFILTSATFLISFRGM